MAQKPSSKSLQRGPRDNVWVKCLSASGNIRGIAIEMTGLIQEQGKLHGLKGEALQLFGESIVAALMVASYCKRGERINLNIRGNGDYIRQAVIDADALGNFRGYVVPVENPLASRATKKTSNKRVLKVAQLEKESRAIGLWGEGVLSILRTKELTGEEPYQGVVPLLTGYLPKDLTYYWYQSEQVPSAVGITVKVDKAKVLYARGFMVQAMPGAADSELKLIEKQIKDLPSIEEEGGRIEEPTFLMGQLFQDMMFTILEETPLSFTCKCSRERAERALALAGAAEMKAIIEEQGQAVVKCDFCLNEYKFSKKQLQEMVDQSRTES